MITICLSKQQSSIGGGIFTFAETSLSKVPNYFINKYWTLLVKFKYSHRLLKNRGEVQDGYWL